MCFLSSNPSFLIIYIFKIFKEALSEYTLSESLKSGGKQTLNSKSSDLIDPSQSSRAQSRKLLEINGFVYLPKIEVVNFPIN